MDGALASGHARSRSAINNASNSPEPLRILLAEDGEVNQLVAFGLPEMKGHHVEIVDNGQAAVDASQQDRYDVILMDVEMPGMDGIEATRMIRQAEADLETLRTPIIAMTAHAVNGFECAVWRQVWMTS